MSDGNAFLNQMVEKFTAMSSIERVEAVTGIAQVIGGFIASKYGLKAGEAATNYLLGEAAWTASTN